MARLAFIAVILVTVAGILLASLNGDRDAIAVRIEPTPSPSAPLVPPPVAARAAATRFLDSYVEPNGRVVRRDQDGDTVSEGQAYALLLAVALGDAQRFADVWRWTERRLLRGDGLLAFRWKDGKVIDAQSATDADLDGARALLLAARRFDEPGYRRAGLRMGRGILSQEAVDVGNELVLVAGPWARSPVFVNPSYFAPRSYATIGAASGDDRWSKLAGSSRALLNTLTTPDRLPPDWARIDHAGTIEPSGAPSSPRDLPRYGFDAVRVPIRMAGSCDASDRTLAAQLWPLLEHAGAGRDAVELTLDGDPLAAARHPAAMAAAAAAAHAAGDGEAARALLDAADAQDLREPSYYGGAVLALARVTLDTDLLGACA
jgi:endo-1,4-beta-D-glucanase Y